MLTSISFMPSKAKKLKMRKPYTSPGSSSSFLTRSRQSSPSTTRELGEMPLTAMLMHLSLPICIKKGSCEHIANISKSSSCKSDLTSITMSSDSIRNSRRSWQQTCDSPTMMLRLSRHFSMAHSIPMTDLAEMEARKEPGSVPKSAGNVSRETSLSVEQHPKIPAMNV